MPTKKLFILLLLSSCFKCFAQIYPSGITTNLLAPYSIFLDEYANPITPKIKATVVFTDFTEPSWNIYLKLKITGPNFSIESKPGIKPPQAVNVVPGVPYEILGADLDWYFNNSNLSFYGISRAQLEANNNRLPEGFYTYCFEVMDYETGKKISLPHCASTYLTLNDPPIVIAPTCGNAIENLTQQNILFQWQIANTNGSLNVSSLNYQIDLYEVNNNYSNPLMAIANNQALPIWQSQPISQNSYLYGPAEPPLEKGKRYVFTVKAIEQGKSQFKNNGVSQACWFYYGYPEGGAINLISLPNNYQLGLKDNGYFTWSRPSNVINNAQMVGYQFRISPLLDGQDEETALLNNTPFHEHYIQPTTSNPKSFALAAEDMMRLTKMKPYVWQVKGISGQQEIAKSPIYKFTGPPVIEKFLAGTFEVTVTELTSYDSITHKISGKGKIILNEIGQAPEFNFNNITLTPIGNNGWAMTEGLIKDAIIVNSYSLIPDSVQTNKNAEYAVDSIVIDVQKLQLGGFVSWKFPLGVTGNTIPYINSKRQLLTLNHSFKLTSSQTNSLQQDYELSLLEPGGFHMHLDNSSQVYVQASKYNFNFNGYVELPESVQDVNNTKVKVPFSEVGQLFYIKQQNVNTSEGIRFVTNTNMELKPRDYVFDFSEKISEGDVSADSTWKGFYMNKASLVVPINAEGTGQISASGILDESVFNITGDSTNMLVNQNGLTFKTRVFYNPSTDTLKFNTFTSVTNEFKIDVVDNTVNTSHLTGNIRVPVLDTSGAFPYYIKLDEFGFGTGYLLNALNGYTFTFCASGGEEQKINITITRAVFKNNNRLEMDMNLIWPHFNLNLVQLQKFCAWGNGNIGFETPNGIVPLTYQQNGKVNGYDIQAERIGCGRIANVYSFGISSRIIMAEDISGEDGAPISNAYSMYKNPLLSGDYTSMSFTMGGDSTRTDSTQVSQTVSEDLNTNITQTLSDLGMNPSTTSPAGDLNGVSGNNGNSIISGPAYLDLQKIIALAEAFLPYIDKSDDSTGMGLVRICKYVINDNEFKLLIDKSPQQLMNDLVMEAANAIVSRINQPILNISNKATTKIRSTINTKVVTPVTSKIDSLIAKALNKIRDNIANQLEDQDPAIKTLVSDVVNSVKTNLSNEIRNSIVNSVETNVTSKITGFIEVGITGKITGFVRKEVRTVASNIIETGVSNSVNLNSIAQNAETVFKDIGDTIVDAITSINLNTIKNTTENVANDIVNGISFERIGERILADLMNQGLSAAVTSIISNQLSNMDGAGAGVAKAVLSTVKFDCTNIGDKLKNGQIDQIVKFDFTNIYITVGVADIQGQLKFTKDDPVYGNSFQAMVSVTVKAPDKKKPISGTLKFINGKTTQSVDNFAYWFFSGKILGLNLKLGSIPFTIDGFEGTVYSKMKKMGTSQPIPFATNKYGIGARMFLFDTPTNGKIIAFDVGLDVIVNNGGFAIELNGTGNVGNLKTSNSGGSSSMFSVATATGYIGYYSEEKRVQGAFGVTFNTAPLLCASGEMGVKVDGINHTWEVYIGKKATPIAAKILCKDNLASGGYFDMKNTGIEAGFFLNVDVEAETPWLGTDDLKVKGWANFGFGIDAYTTISFEPSFKINDAYISAWATAGIGFDYETNVKSGSVTIAGVSLSGSLLYINHEKAELHGQMDGSVTILNQSVDVSMRVDYDVEGKRKISG